MKKTTLGALACVAITGAVQIAHAADHRDAYEINLRPSANLADVFVFASPDTSDTVVFGLTVSGLGSPDNNLSYAFDDAVVYQVAIDTNEDLEFDRTFDFTFQKPTGNDDGTYAQDYSVSFNGAPMMSATTTPVSVRSIDPVISQSGEVNVFAGPTDDPFFGDVAGFYLQDFPGRDGFAGMNTLSIVIEVPFAMISEGPGPIAVSSFVYDADGAQIDRMAMPLINAAMIPSALRDTYNASRPIDDVANFGDILGALMPDVLRFDLQAAGSFPNGRKPSDDVVGLLLKVDDNVDANDRSFPAQFPYLATPHMPN